VRIDDGVCRIFDFETSGWGPVAFDAAYLLAPFPSCWCFASLPAEIAGLALDAYRARLEAEGIGLGAEWEDLTTAVLAGLLIARGPMLAEALGQDSEWGTTTIRPRLLTWLRSFTCRAGDGTLHGFRPPPARCTTGSPSAGPDCGYPSTRPSRGPARRWPRCPTGGSLPCDPRPRPSGGFRRARCRGTPG